MNSYYEILELDRDADSKQIKSAYFRLVRKYSPERDQETFKQLRAAYETLSDENKRKEYDRAGSLSGEAGYLFTQGKKARQEGRLSDSTEIFKKGAELYPEFPLMKTELARSYEYEEKHGKALAVWKELFTLNPDNTEYSFELAKSYHLRGWRNKALAQFRQTVKLDPGNAGAWAGLIDCHGEAREWAEARRLCAEALTALNQRNIDSVRIHIYSLTLSRREKDSAAALNHMKSIVDIMRKNTKYPRDECKQTLLKLIEIAVASGGIDMLPYLKEIAGILPGMDENLREAMESAELTILIDSLEKKGFSVLFPDLFEIITGECDCEDCKNDITAMECNILMDTVGYRPQIIRLKTEYPLLYALHAAFFNEALLSRDPDKLLYKRMKMLSKQGVYPANIPANATIAEPAETDFSEKTIRRDGSKVGRNDPCPCGSGKKYKKCCGT